MNLENWISLAREHWKEFQPTRFKELQQTGKLKEALAEAAERTHLEMSDLENAGLTTHEAWEMVRELYLFPPEESGEQEEPVASEAARAFNELTRLHSKLLQAEDEDE